MSEHFFGLTDTGQIAGNNEDAFIAKQVSDQFMLACVIDGVGGYEGGEVAAALAQEAILQVFSRHISDPQKKLRDALVLANEKIYNERKKSAQHRNMACVLTAVISDAVNNQFYFAHIGDTRLYLFRDNSLVKITSDHSFVGFLEDSGRLSEDDARFHPKRNEINKALGFDPNLGMQSDYIDTGNSPFLPGDTLLLCSDGLTDMISSREIRAVMASNKSLKEKAQILVDEANDSGGKDNITVVLVQNPNKPVEHEVTRPVATGRQNSLEGEEKQKVLVKRKPRSNRGLIFFLVLLCLALIAFIFWQSYDDWFGRKEKVIVAAKPQSSPKEQMFRDSLNSATQYLKLSDSVFAGRITISDTAILNKDSFYLDGSGIVLTADSLYKGAAFYIPENAGYIVIENIQFENFPVAIHCEASGIALRNVQFRNCGRPVRYQLRFAPGKYVSGVFGDSLFFQTDSLQK